MAFHWLSPHKLTARLRSSSTLTTSSHHGCQIGPQWNDFIHIWLRPSSLHHSATLSFRHIAVPGPGFLCKLTCTERRQHSDQTSSDFLTHIFSMSQFWRMVLNTKPSQIRTRKLHSHLRLWIKSMRYEVTVEHTITEINWWLLNTRSKKQLHG